MYNLYSVQVELVQVEYRIEFMHDKTCAHTVSRGLRQRHVLDKNDIAWVHALPVANERPLAVSGAIDAIQCLARRLHPSTGKKRFFLATALET